MTKNKMPFPFWRSVKQFEKYLMDYHKAKITVKKDYGKVVLIVAHKEPINKKPNWIWHLYKFSMGYIALCMSEEHINKTEALMPYFFDFYDQDNKNKRLKKRFGEK